MIPTKKQFLLDLKRLSAPLPDPLLNECAKRLLLSRSDDEAHSVLLELVSAHRQLFSRPPGPGAITWLEQQSRFRSARDGAFGQGKGQEEYVLSNEERAAVIWDSLQQRCELFDSECSLRERKRTAKDPDAIQEIGRQIQEVFDRRVYREVRQARWLIIVLTAFLEYFHEPDTVARYLAHRKHVADLVKVIEKGLQAQQELFKAPIYSDDLWFTKATQLASEIQTVRLAQMDILYELERAKLGTLPIRRDDETARDRLLVYRLWLGNKLVFGEPKQACIRSLLSLDGVVGLSEEGIRKCIKGFDDGYVERGFRHYDHLLENTRRFILGR